MVAARQLSAGDARILSSHPGANGDGPPRTEEEVLRWLADEYGLEFSALEAIEPDKQVLSLFPARILLRDELLPLRRVNGGSVEVATSLPAALDGADAVMALRAQLERGATLPAEIAEWQLHSERMNLAGPDVPILHPGPTNEGVEISGELANGPRSLIGRQVENGVPVRMAVLALVAGAA